jgi:hypothetical protein
LPEDGGKERQNNMDEKKVKKWGMRIYYVLAILFFVFIHAPFGYAIGGLMTLAEPYVWFYILSVGIAISYLGRFWWIYPLILWPEIFGNINGIINTYAEYGNRVLEREIRWELRNIPRYMIVIAGGWVVWLFIVWLRKKILK